jgi:hypothetical protein
MKLSVSLRFTRSQTFDRTPWVGDQLSQGLYLYTNTEKRTYIHKHQIFMPWVGFEPTIPASEQPKTVHVLDRQATVIGTQIWYGWDSCFSLAGGKDIRVQCWIHVSRNGYINGDHASLMAPEAGNEKCHRLHKGEDYSHSANNRMFAC